MDITERKAAQVALEKVNEQLRQAIAQRERAEQALRRSQLYFRSLIGNISDIITVIDAAGVLRDASPSLKRHLGYEADEFIGHDIFQLIHPNDRAPAAAAFTQVLDQVSSVRTINMRFRSRAGEWRTYEAISKPLQIDNEKLIVINLHEVTQQIQTAKTLQQANAKLVRTMRVKDEFLTHMSHELRTPLNTILSLSEALEAEIFGPISDRQRHPLQSIQLSGRHLLSLINDILDLAKIEAGRFQLNRTHIQIEPLVQQSLVFVQPSASQKEISLFTQVEPEVTEIVADERQLKQILINLLSNAVKFTPEGGTVGVVVEANQEDHTIHLTVWDTGIGIAPEEQQHLFQPFVQLDSSLSRQYPGTGLGLALVQRMVEMHGGRVVLESEVGRGSRFTVILPMQPGVDAQVKYTDLASNDPEFTIATTVPKETTLDDPGH